MVGVFLKFQDFDTEILIGLGLSTSRVASWGLHPMPILFRFSMRSSVIVEYDSLYVLRIKSFVLPHISNVVDRIAVLLQ
jgi:hypothetical protein